jgi:hypothetical protein
MGINNVRVKVYRHKYLRSQDLFKATAPPSSSITWRSITKAFSYLRDGFVYKLGKGEVSLWHDPWLEQGSIAALIDFVCISNSDLQVKIFGTTEHGILAQLWLVFKFGSGTLFWLSQFPHSLILMIVLLGLLLILESIPLNQPICGWFLDQNNLIETLYGTGCGDYMPQMRSKF